MKKVNLRDLYPDVYKTDHFVEVTEDVLEAIRATERAEAAYDRRMYRYKAHYSLDSFCSACHSPAAERPSTDRGKRRYWLKNPGLS